MYPIDRELEELFSPSLVYPSDPVFEEQAILSTNRDSHSSMSLVSLYIETVARVRRVYPIDRELEELAILSTNRDSHSSMSLVSPCGENEGKRIK